MIIRACHIFSNASERNVQTSQAAVDSFRCSIARWSKYNFFENASLRGEAVKRTKITMSLVQFFVSLIVFPQSVLINQLPPHDEDRRNEKISGLFFCEALLKTMCRLDKTHPGRKSRNSYIYVTFNYSYSRWVTRRRISSIHQGTNVARTCLSFSVFAAKFLLPYFSLWITNLYAPTKNLVTMILDGKYLAYISLRTSDIIPLAQTCLLLTLHCQCQPKLSVSQCCRLTWG